MTLIQRCIALFELLPTSPPHRWLIAADWLEEKGAEVEAAAFREGLVEVDQVPLDAGGRSRNCYGYGHGSGHGVGSVDGGGEGSGTGDVNGCDNGYGYTNGFGNGDGKGR